MTFRSVLRPPSRISLPVPNSLPVLNLVREGPLGMGVVLHTSTISVRPTSHERQQKLMTKVHTNLAFQARISFLRCFRTPGTPIRTILVKTGMLPCLVP